MSCETTKGGEKMIEKRYLLLIIEGDEIILYDKKHDVELSIPYSEVELYISYSEEFEDM